MSDTLERIKVALADRYTIERELGRGGMATVYLAEDLKHHRKVAIKVLRPELAATLGVDRFYREIEIVANLNHPHILPLLDSGTTEEQPSAVPADRPTAFLFYVMPFIEGETIRDRLDSEHQLPLEEAIQLTREVADALDYAHSEGVIHRDIKPENIMLSRGHAVVADFGIARAVSLAGGERLTETGMTLGTPAYMSPEQAMAEEVDGRSDIYSLGCVLYEMLGGDPPYIGSTPRSVLARKLADPVPSLRALRTVVSGELEAVIGKALVREPVDRYKTAAAFAAALSAPPGITTPGDTTPVERLSDPHGRRMAVTLAGVATALLVAVAGLWIAFGRGGTTLDRERVVVLPLENQTGDGSLDDVGRVAADRLAQGLMQTGLLQAVLPRDALRAVRAFSSQDDVLDRQTYMLGWAGDVGAGTLVHGAYAQRGDSLSLQVQSTEVQSGDLILSLDPVGANTSDPMDGIDDLMQRVMGALASTLDLGSLSATEGAALATRPPNWDAYLAYITGQELFTQGHMREAATYYKEAHQRDSSFVNALFMAAMAHINMGQFATVDSLTEIAASGRDQLPPLNRLQLDWYRAMLDGNTSGKLSASREMVQLAPSSGWHRTAAQDALKLNRPGEALDLYQSFDLESRPRQDNWFVLTRANHMLADHRTELNTALHAQKQFPDDIGIRTLEIFARVALGRVDDAARRLDDALTLPPDRFGTSAKTLLEATAMECRAHGFRELAHRLFDRALDWLADRPDDEASTWNHRYDIASIHYLAEHWQEASVRFETLAVESGTDLDVQGYLGVLAARRGDEDEAERASEWLRDLDTQYLFGRHTYWRARIAALLGDSAGAVRILRAALSEGLQVRRSMFANAPYLTIHMEMDFEALHNYEPFRELLRPKG